MKGSEIINELKRRHVFRTAAAYLVVSWFILQFADVAVPGVQPINILIVLAAFFPVAIALSWIFNITITLDSIKSTFGLHEDVEKTVTGNAKNEFIAHSAPAGSVAVLAFANIGGDSDNEYFSDGLSEDIIDALAKVPSLQVVARTSAFAFKNKNEDIRDIGARLNVAYVIEGSVRKSGDKMRVVAQLIRVENGYHVWSETYDRKLQEVYDTLDEITQSIAIRIIDSLSQTEGSTAAPAPNLITRHTLNIDAYHLYLKGRYFWNQRGQGIMTGLEYFQQAAAADSRYALPYVGLADCYALLGYYGYMLPEIAFPKAHENATKALSLDDSLADAHTSKGLVKMYYDWDWDGARIEFNKAIELDPRYAPARYWISVLHTVLSDPEAALEQDRIALEVDPVSPFLNVHHGWTLHCANREEEAIEQYLKTLELDSKLWSAYQLLTYAYCQLGRFDEAIAAGETLKAGTANNILPLPSMGYTYAKAGDRDKALSIIDELNSREGEFFWPSHVAAIYAELGEQELAAEWMEKAFSVRDHWLITLLVEPGFEAIRQLPDFEQYVERIGLPRKAN